MSKIITGWFTPHRNSEVEIMETDTHIRFKYPDGKVYEVERGCIELDTACEFPLGVQVGGEAYHWFKEKLMNKLKDKDGKLVQDFVVITKDKIILNVSHSHFRNVL